MGKIDDNDDQVEAVAKILKELTRTDEKKEEQREEVLEFTEILAEKQTENNTRNLVDDDDEEEEEEDIVDYEPLRQEIHLDDEPVVEKQEPDEEEDMPEEEDIPEEEEVPEEEDVSEEEDMPEEEDLPEEEEVPEKEEVPEEEDVPEPETEPEPAVKTTVKKKAMKKTSANAPSRKTSSHTVKEPEPVPMTKGKLAGTLIRKFIFCVSLGVFAFALTGLLILLWGYYTSQREYDQINDDYVVIGTGTAPENSDENSDMVVNVSTNDADDDDTVPFLDITVDERKLKALNEDYAFYIVIPGTNIQYPVVQGDDNNHYLRYTYSNQENTAGSIQVDYRTDRDTYLETFNTIIHGHNRQDGTMFSDLANYIDESYRDENPYIYIIMGDKEYVYEIFAFYDMIPVAVCYNPNTEDMTYLSFIEENNTYTCDIEVTVEDRIISLYTCNDDSSMRYLVHAVLREIYDLS